MKSALLVIDIQNLPVEDQPYAIAERLRLWQNSLAQARQAGIEVIHVRHHDQELVKGTADWEIHPFVAPLENEMIFDKTFNSAFKETGLHAYYVTFSPSRSVRCVTNKPPAMRVRDEGYTKKTPNAIQ